MTGATERVASFISRTSLEAMPAEAVPKAKKAIADTFAAILSGVGSEVAEPLRRYLQAAGARAEQCPSSAPEPRARPTPPHS